MRSLRTISRKQGTSIAYYLRRNSCDRREVADRDFKTVRDVAVFTNKRLIVKDVQGLTGTKVEIYSLPYSAVNMWSTENAGILDYTAEVELWTRSDHIKIELKRGIDIREFERLLAEYVL